MGNIDSISDKILSLYREMNFSNDANTKIALSLGNLHRSTITEYLKGMTFQFFFEENYDLDKVVRRMNPDPEPELDGKIKNRIIKYLNNLASKIDRESETDINLKNLQAHLKKLPKKYHAAALNIAKAYMQNLWDLF